MNQQITFKQSDSSSYSLDYANSTLLFQNLMRKQIKQAEIKKFSKLFKFPSKSISISQLLRLILSRIQVSQLIIQLTKYRNKIKIYFLAKIHIEIESNFKVNTVDKDRVHTIQIFQQKFYFQELSLIIHLICLSR
ncbi:hypothetical protein TTHERM_000989341 (macronuclear) [Tetrahymena thermophila SB210]|uniref:Uncharacterized protein n=1 Tax=Tetrahymena thermophila (strain SB210) TaxID=312017 RepID=W7XFE5_TETTS|nr:hypothetical protein TTHERM_000989341 [Tetrahymena thermophila SB210]EWS72726.1 hypothetical protein TTHERM_000989341 [Tetrahymena thermophila SB210]|eukprot:XP_012654733.1 hypothetical protein TTHERM_000989341 [Tetrahymena thermophila SB210]